MDNLPAEPVRILIIGAGLEMNTRLRDQFRAAMESGLVVLDYQQIEDRIVANVGDKFDVTFLDDLNDQLTPRQADYVLRRRREEELPLSLDGLVLGKPKHNNGKGMRDRWGRVRGRYR